MKKENLKFLKHSLFSSILWLGAILLLAYITTLVSDSLKDLVYTLILSGWILATTTFNEEIANYLGDLNARWFLITTFFIKRTKEDEKKFYKHNRVLYRYIILLPVAIVIYLSTVSINHYFILILIPIVLLRLWRRRK